MTFVEPEQKAWRRQPVFPAAEATALRERVTIPLGVIGSYCHEHEVTEETARVHLLALVEEAAVRGSVVTKETEHLMKLMLPRSAGKYHVMIDSRRLTLFSYRNKTGTPMTWVQRRSLAAGAADARALLKQEQKEAKKRRQKSDTQALCLTWSGRPVDRPEPGVPLRVWRQLRHLNVAAMVCNRAVADSAYFSTTPDGERLTAIQAELQLRLADVTERQVRPRPDGFTVQHGPLAWHLRRDGRLLEQITIRSGHAHARYTGPATASFQ
ncbi:hypothetical protein ACFVQ9_25855 [Streptomyces goshikiensis]|uniref:hypothetical protein n=1 Tax=Streptomyces goshikiensis TaxID=1942 RepID=UPI0036C75934